MNCAFVKAEQLEGNVGYVRFDGCSNAELSARPSRSNELRRRRTCADPRSARERRWKTRDGRSSRPICSSAART